MKILSGRYLLLIALFLVFMSAPFQAKAEISIGFSIGSPPPPRPVIVEHRWDPPGPGAVWVEAHYEWEHGQWVWYHGYYIYPPYPGAVYFPGHYERHHDEHRWIPGYWR